MYFILQSVPKTTMAANSMAKTTVPLRRAAKLATNDYRLLAEFRYLVRSFLEFSEAAAVRAGLTTRQHQALLTIKGVQENTLPTIGYLADRLRIQHHSAVELVDRLVEAKLITRKHDPNDRRRVSLALTAAAERHLVALSTSHMIELTRMQPALLEILNRAKKVQRAMPDNFPKLGRTKNA